MTPEQDFHARAVELVSKSCDSSSKDKRTPVEFEVASNLSVLNPHSEAYIVHGMIEGQEVMLVKSFDDEQKINYAEIDGNPIENPEESQRWWSKYGNLAVEIYNAEEQLRKISTDGIGLEV